MNTCKNVDVKVHSSILFLFVFEAPVGSRTAAEQ